MRSLAPAPSGAQAVLWGIVASREERGELAVDGFRSVTSESACAGSPVTPGGWHAVSGCVETLSIADTRHGGVRIRRRHGRATQRLQSVVERGPVSRQLAYRNRRRQYVEQIVGRDSPARARRSAPSGASWAVLADDAEEPAPRMDRRAPETPRTHSSRTRARHHRGSRWRAACAGSARTRSTRPGTPRGLASSVRTRVPHATRSRRGRRCEAPRRMRRAARCTLPALGRDPDVRERGAGPPKRLASRDRVGLHARGIQGRDFSGGNDRRERGVGQKPDAGAVEGRGQRCGRRAGDRRQIVTLGITNRPRALLEVTDVLGARDKDVAAPRRVSAQDEGAGPRHRSRECKRSRRKADVRLDADITKADRVVTELGSGVRT